MQPSMLRSRHEKMLLGDEPVHINVRRDDIRLQRELKEANLRLKKVAEHKHANFVAERSSARAWADKMLGRVVGNLEGVALPGELEPPMKTVPSSSFINPVEKKGFNTTSMGRLREWRSSLLPRTVRFSSALRVPENSKTEDTSRCSCDDSLKRDDDYALPTGFPTPFGSSGFQQLPLWVETSFNEALLTIEGPQSERERKGTGIPPQRLLVSVACYLLNELLSRDKRFESLWPPLRDVIFRALFVPTNFHQSKCDDAADPPTYPSFEKERDYADLELWSDAYVDSRRENAHKEDKIQDLKSAVVNSRRIISLAEKQINRLKVQCVFRVWRATARRGQAFRSAAVAYFRRTRQRFQLECSFLRWRRIGVQGTATELRQLLTESETQYSLLKGSTTKTIENLEKQLDLERRENTILKMQKDSLTSQLVTKQVMDLRLLDDTLRRYETTSVEVKKECKRWERLAKTFTCRWRCPPISTGIRKSALSLRAIEAECALQVYSIHGRVSEARRWLESLLISWVNAFMKEHTKDATWFGVTKIDTGYKDGDMDLLALSKLVHALEDLYSSLSPDCLSPPGSSSFRTHSPVTPLKGIAADYHRLDSSPSCFHRLNCLIRKQSVEGLFPPLLSHCPYLNTFYDPVLFCNQQHPTGMVWVLSTLLVGYARLMGGGPSFASHDVDSRLRSEAEHAIDWVVPVRALGPDAIIGDKRASSRPSSSLPPITLDTVIKKHASVKHPRQKHERKESSVSKAKTNVEVTGQEVSQEDLDRLVDTASDIEVYLGLGEREGDGLCSDASNSPVDKALDSLRSQSPHNDSGADASGHKGPSKCSGRVSPCGPKTRVPAISKALLPVTQKEFVKFHWEENQRRREWVGVARVVTSLIVRFRILDLPPSVLQRAIDSSPVSDTAPTANVSGRANQLQHSPLGPLEKRRPKRALTESPVSSSSLRGPAPSPVAQPVTLRRWLEGHQKP
ncbi:hypothetical protein TRVL_00350 [Trypanosoma vivax]|uniref:Uncharacterized protein n=1 Tax=Trypanosoma vivax (strain Y486) TaxID=1055687 RepID=G0UCR4_TRYVY|nr:hypothetical protein TRVL_00350 [Trypanosoma vivax]CCC53624.1 conserved hypothetical protein [Trypanosoma vivax Y486]